MLLVAPLLYFTRNKCFPFVHEQREPRIRRIKKKYLLQKKNRIITAPNRRRTGTSGCGSPTFQNRSEVYAAAMYRHDIVSDLRFFDKTCDKPPIVVCFWVRGVKLGICGIDNIFGTVGFPSFLRVCAVRTLLQSVGFKNFLCSQSLFLQTGQIDLDI